MPRLTKTSVDALRCLTGGPIYLWDHGLAGFGVKALPTGGKKYVVKYRSGGGGRAAPQRWLTLGSHGQLTVSQARDLAQQALAAVARGEDPQREKFNLRRAPILNDLWHRFTEEVLPSKKDATQRDYRAHWERFVGPRLGKLLVSDVSRGDVGALHKKLKETPYLANRTLALCSRLLTLAEVWEWRAQGTNPCRYIPRYGEKSRTRYLSGAEITKLGSALRSLTVAGSLGNSSACAIRLLLLTGARLNEVLTAKWAWVDWERCVLALPDSKTGEKSIYLSDAALAVLREQQIICDGSSDYIFASAKSGKHLVNLRKPWIRVCEEAEIKGVRLHDLRHTAASVAVGQGASLALIGRLLGHCQAQTTLRYAHVDIDPALRTANLMGNVIAAQLAQPKS